MEIPSIGEHKVMVGFGVGVGEGVFVAVTEGNGVLIGEGNGVSVSLLTVLQEVRIMNTSMNEVIHPLIFNDFFPVI